MRNRLNQVYEDYWNYTAAFTNFNGVKFLKVLRASLDFIDAHKDEGYSPTKYNDLQEALNIVQYCDDLTSQRKRINQLVKLGFIKPYLTDYPPESREYLTAGTDKKRKSILSKIVYKYANLCNATTNDIRTKQLTFFLKSLDAVGHLTTLDLATLMTIDIATFPKDHANREDIQKQCSDVDVNGFVRRKYNQISHLKNLLGKLDDLVIRDDSIYYATDALRLFGDKEERKEVRDPYLQRVFKYELEEESTIHYQSTIPKCMLEGLTYPVLIASHIKPYKDSDEKEAFDINNGLLLSKNLDSLFDLGYITFSDEGIIIPSRDLGIDVVDYIRHFRLDRDFVNPKRMVYMEYHRKNVFEKRYKIPYVRKYALIE